MSGKNNRDRAKAKRVVHLFMNGGPSHVDTFDPKPMLSKYHGKPVPSNRPTERKTGAALAGTASAVFNTFRQVGGAVAIAVFGALIASPPTFVPGLRVSFATAAALLLASALLSLRIRRCR